MHEPGGAGSVQGGVRGDRDHDPVAGRVLDFDVQRAGRGPQDLALVRAALGALAGRVGHLDELDADRAEAVDLALDGGAGGVGARGHLRIRRERPPSTGGVGEPGDAAVGESLPHGLCSVPAGRRAGQHLSGGGGLDGAIRVQSVAQDVAGHVTEIAMQGAGEDLDEPGTGAAGGGVAGGLPDAGPRRPLLGQVR